ncbi:MAG: hypothetical protein IPH23_10505 [Gammaproteobacteria bacterium]|nr:hypothetical protein [Gammaproteobacteria bacterium]
MSDSDSVTLLVGVGATAGAFLGIFVTALLSRANATSTLRQDWINSIRAVLSKYLTHAEIFIDVPDKKSKEAYKAKIALLEYVHQAKLYLNEGESKSRDLLKLMQELPNKYSKEEHATREYQTEKPKISSLMQDVLKEEWNRVRDGEILWSINNFFKMIRLPKWLYISRIRLFWTCVLLIV